jgi:hypothetical protein
MKQETRMLGNITADWLIDDDAVLLTGRVEDSDWRATGITISQGSFPEVGVALTPQDVTVYPDHFTFNVTVPRSQVIPPYTPGLCRAELYWVAGDDRLRIDTAKFTIPV